VSHFPFHATGLQNPLATAAPVGIRLAIKGRQENVARKSKIEQPKETNATSAVPESPARISNGMVAPKAKAKPTSAGSKKKKTTPKKEKAHSPVKPAATKKTAPAKTAGPSDEQIRIRAYFIAEGRHRLAIAGDSAHDWIEAKRQLIEESGPASS
jgi:hypothetical protein